MKILAIDPGPEKSAFVLFDGGKMSVCEFGFQDNGELSSMLRIHWAYEYELVIEKVQHYGKQVGSSVFETVYWSGMFAGIHICQPFSRCAKRITQPEVKLHLCGTARANDAGVRNALIDKFPKTGKNGKGESSSVGTRKFPGPLYKISLHVWSALAVAVTYFEKTSSRNGNFLGVSYGTD